MVPCACYLLHEPENTKKNATTRTHICSYGSKNITAELRNVVQEKYRGRGASGRGFVQRIGEISFFTGGATQVVRKDCRSGNGILSSPGWRWHYKPRVGVYTLYRAVFNKGRQRFRPGLLELQMNIRISGPRTGFHPRRMALALPTPADTQLASAEGVLTP